MTKGNQMDRKNKRKKNTGEKIVVQLTETGLTLRIIFLSLAILAATAAFYSVFAKVLHTESGWQTLPARNVKTVAGEEIFCHYDFGAGDTAAAEEWRKLNKLFPRFIDRAYRIFDTEEAEGLQGLYALMTHPNEEIVLEPELYEALSLLDRENSRFIFYGPVYEVYRGLFHCENDFEAESFDPAVNEEMAAYIAEVNRFAQDPAQIRIELNDGKAELVVSAEYLDFLRENEVRNVLDFWAWKNAFAADCAAKELRALGYENGYISTVEGYAVSLGGREYTMTIFDHDSEAKNYPAENITCSAGSNSVSLYGYLVLGHTEDRYYYYEREEEGHRNVFLDPESGLCRAADREVLAVSDSLSCGELLVKIWERFLEETGDYSDLSEEGITTYTVTDKKLIRA